MLGRAAEVGHRVVEASRELHEIRPRSADGSGALERGEVAGELADGVAPAAGSVAAKQVWDQHHRPRNSEPEQQQP
jgi:hypothetical protein